MTVYLVIGNSAREVRAVFADKKDEEQYAAETNNAYVVKREVR